MKILFTLFLAAFLASAQAGVTVEWTVASGGNGHFYGITETPSDWLSAEAWGVIQGGHLASINSAEEQAFIEATFLVGDLANKPLWIGLANVVPAPGPKKYDVWSSGEPVTFTNWNPASTDPELPQEPNDLNGNENYVALNWHFAFGYDVKPGTWNDIPLNGITGFDGRANGPHYGVFEVIPEPSTYVLLLSAAPALGWWWSRKRLRIVSA